MSYFLDRSANRPAAPPFTPLAAGMPDQPGTTTFTETNAVALPSVFYRVRVVE